MIYEVTSWNVSMTEMASFNTLERMMEYIVEIASFKARRVILRVLVESRNEWTDIRDLSSYDHDQTRPNP